MRVLLRFVPAKDVLHVQTSCWERRRGLGHGGCGVRERHLLGVPRLRCCVRRWLNAHREGLVDTFEDGRYWGSSFSFADTCENSGAGRRDSFSLVIDLLALEGGREAGVLDAAIAGDLVVLVIDRRGWRTRPRRLVGREILHYTHTPRCRAESDVSTRLRGP